MVDRDSIGLPVKLYNRDPKGPPNVHPVVADSVRDSGNVTTRKSKEKPFKPKVLGRFPLNNGQLSKEVPYSAEGAENSIQTANSKMGIPGGDASSSKDLIRDVETIPASEAVQIFQTSVPREELLSDLHAQEDDHIARNSSSTAPVVKSVEAVISTEEKPNAVCTGPHKKKLRSILNSVNNAPNRYSGIPDRIVALSTDDENKVIRFLNKGRVYGFPNSDGSTFSNYFHYVRNNHPLFAIFLSHPLHPFTKKSRLIVFFCVLCLAYSLSVALLSNYYFHDVSQITYHHFPVN
jgi:hypothetical protein